MLWLREQLSGGNVHVSCTDMSDNACAALELVSAFHKLVSRSEELSKKRHEVLMVVSCGDVLWEGGNCSGRARLIKDEYQVYLSYLNTGVRPYSHT